MITISSSFQTASMYSCPTQLRRRGSLFFGASDSHSHRRHKIQHHLVRCLDMMLPSEFASSPRCKRPSLRRLGRCVLVPNLGILLFALVDLSDPGDAAFGKWA